ncbi:MAG: helix-turn-helix domain-containing protein [Rhodocyclaceae bacterium]|nr:helix-turn-helix domain-containing protein [Rhodocyclaceae bacterium]MCA3116392.1 helix-turn-helix domain-containing protein [Rhodocyclaceae bacterium]MCA3127067.1 helix-turn-helix domain-containing protein [Rhodocyclaceae bacterium]
MNTKLLIQKLGGPKRVAAICECKAPSVYSWVRIPVDRCPSLELASHGDVTVEQMRPDIRWTRVRDRKWPHPAGRPLVDYSEAAA